MCLLLKREKTIKIYENDLGSGTGNKAQSIFRIKVFDLVGL
jgi:hypothetical protein